VPTLPPVPKVGLDVIADKSHEREGFLALKRYDLIVVREDGSRSKPFRYDLVDRVALHASVMAAHHRGEGGRPHVWLRSAIRPPIGLSGESPVLWELPAGLIEPGEEPRVAAARELDEELGFQVSPEAMLPLGGSTYPAPGFVGEKHWFFHVEVDPSKRRPPGGDGSPLEAEAMIESVPVDEALDACRRGEIRDAKTELALRRLIEIL
jgi:ADP-ribose pyrophosphatase